MKPNALTFEQLHELMDFVGKTDKKVLQIHTTIDYTDRTIFYIEFMGNGTYATFHYRDDAKPMYNKILEWLKG